MMGDRGEAISGEVQPGCSTGAPGSPVTFQAAIEFFEGATSQRAPAASCQLANSPETTAGNAAPVSEAASTRCRWPSPVAAASTVFLFHSKTTGDETNAWFAER